MRPPRYREKAGTETPHSVKMAGHNVENIGRPRQLPYAAVLYSNLLSYGKTELARYSLISET